MCAEQTFCGRLGHHPTHSPTWHLNTALAEQAEESRAPTTTIILLCRAVFLLVGTGEMGEGLL